jgi:hypothetical protein
MKLNQEQQSKVLSDSSMGLSLKSIKLGTTPHIGSSSTSVKMYYMEPRDGVQTPWILHLPR